jgi:segregation and condensation protein B
MFRRVAAWGRRILPLSAVADRPADRPIEHQTSQQETMITAMPERTQPERAQPADREAVQPAALPIANQPARPLLAADSEDEAPSRQTVHGDEIADEIADEIEDGVVAEDVVPVLAQEMSTEELSTAEPPGAGDYDDDLALDDPALLPLVSLLESLLFVAEDAVTPDKLAQALNRTIGEVDAGLTILARRCEVENRGVRVQRRSGRVQLVTNPAAAQAVEAFLNLDLSTQLSGPALEALAVIAYQQPVTRTQVEAVRGVDCSGVLRKLQQQGLIEEVGRLETVGRPILYGVTDLFMQHFGLTSLNELPQLPEVDADALAAVIELVEEENNA